MTMSNDQAENTGAAERRRMSDYDFAQYGVQHMAYVRPAEDEDGNAVWSIHAADGTPMGAAGERESALAAVRQYDMEPASVH